MTGTVHGGISDNAAGVISYFTFIPAILFLLLPPYKNSNSVRFHAWQSVLMWMLAFVVYIILGAVALLTLMMSMSFLGYAVRLLSLLWLAVWVACVIRALNGKRLKVPILSGVAEKLAEHS
jgi:uncharacterized membrane protein